MNSELQPFELDVNWIMCVTNCDIGKADAFAERVAIIMSDDNGITDEVARDRAKILMGL